MMLCCVPERRAQLCAADVSGGGGDQHPAPGSVRQRETRIRAEEEAWAQPAQRTQAEHHQELAGRPDFSSVCMNDQMRDDEVL